MKATCALIAALALFSTTTVVVEARAEVTPVQKVLQLLQGMLEKGKKEKHDEQVQYAAYKQFCDDTTTEKTRAIKEADEKISMLTADIAKYAAHAKQLTKEIAVHDLDISVWKGDMDAAGKVRKLEKSDYDALHLDYSESIDALKRAIIVLKDQAYDRKQASSLVQITNLNSLSLIPENAKKAIDLFLAQGLQTEDPVAAPEATGYDFQSTGIIEMLEKLLADFTDKKTEIEKEEMNAEHAYQMLMKDLTMQSDDATADRTSKAELKAAKLEAKASAEGDRNDTTKTKNADKKYLADTTAVCASKTSDFGSRQQLRAEEIVAIEKAIEIISASNVAGAAETYLPTLVQKGSALVQLGRGASTNAQLQKRVASFLHEQGKQLNSRLLETLAVRSAADPFKKVKQMIMDLITRLEEEASAEADHKMWCDTELASNAKTRKEKSDAVDMLTAERDALDASIAKLTSEMEKLTAEIADLKSKMAEETELRASEKATNEETIADAKEAQEAVASALTILKEFYAKAAEATALVQRRQPEIFDSPYKGMQAENGGVVGMLEVILTDFERLEAETATSEASAQKLYTEFMADSKADKKAKERDIEHKTFEKQDESQALALKEKDLAGTEKELSAALEYWDKLKPSCVTVGMSYDERVSRRKQEIESLQQALTILSGEEA
mmetsp:Transcript_117100/g.207096  ORF Transcript_117100/g.207096 Transcript_117100/m.207096 type:complete len:672 (-) Transcript_117100:54-2069(-)